MQQLINSIGKHKKQGNEIMFETCPFCKGGEHNDKWTFAINKRSGLYNCLRGKCGAKGNKQQLAKKLNIRLYSENIVAVSEKQYKKPSRKVYKPTENIKTYFQKRCISEDTYEFAEVKQMIDNQDRIRVVYDYYDEQNELIFRKYRTISGKIINREKDTKPILFMMNKVNPESTELIITEGEEDCLSCYEVGYDFAVSLPSGSSDLTCINHNWEWLQTFDTFIIWTDNDSAGLKAEKELINRLGKAKCKIVNHKAKDANETLRKLGQVGVIETIEDAEYVPIQNIVGVYDLDSIEEDFEHINSTFKFINDNTEGGFRFGEVVVWTGHKATGKSTMLQQDLLKFIQQGQRVCLYSAEMANRRILGSLYRQFAGEKGIKQIPGNDFKGFKYFAKQEEAEKARDFLAENLFFVSDDFDNELGLFELFEQVHIQKGVRVFVIDNLMTAVLQNKDINHNQSEFIKKCVWFCRKYQVQIHLVAHQRKPEAGKKVEHTYRPTSFGVSGSLNIANLVNVIVGIAKVPQELKDKKPENYPHDGEIIILKERVTGREGKATKVLFDYPSLRFIENWHDINYKLT